MSAQAAEKQAEKQAEKPAAHWKRRLARFATVGLAAALALWFIYRAVEARIASSEHYQFDPHSISITPQPDWIHSDVKADVLRESSLDHPLNLLDSTLLERLSKAFALHPWVGQVTSVRKRAGQGVELQLVYRRPVCMVEVPGGLFPVDAEGVLLPTADFTPEAAQRYPRLTGIQTVTEGPVGTRWQDAAVQGAAKIAAILADDWELVELVRIAPLAEAPLDERGNPVFVLYTRHGAQVIWGSTATSGQSEPTPEDKAARLKNLAGALKSRNGSSPPIDLRTPRPEFGFKQPAAE